MVTPIQKARWLGDASDTQMVTSWRLAPGRCALDPQGV